MSLALLLETLSETRERSFQWGSLPPAWVVFLLIVPVVALYVASFYRRERPGEPGRWRWLLGGLRALVILGVLAMLARPLIREIVYQQRDPQVLVMVDDSLSMKIRDKYADRSTPQSIAALFHASPESVERMSRYDLVSRLFKDGEIKFLERLQERGRVVLWAFSGGLKKLRDLPRGGSGASAPRSARAEGGGPAAAGPEGAPAEPGTDLLPDLEKIQGEERVKQTRIGDSILEAVQGSRGAVSAGGDPEIAGVIVFTDGQQNSGALQPEEAARKLAQRGIPVFTVGVGNPAAPKDVRVINLEASDVVLVGDQVGFEATIASDGFEGDRVRVDLFFDGEVADTKYITLVGKGERQSVRLEHVPKVSGDSEATVKVEPNPAELFEDNNSASRPIKVLDQKIKVLYLEGPPRWEYRFLKNGLIRDPTMEAQVLLYSADKDFIQESSPGIAPLKAFPRTREELFQYHVVMIGDVDPESFTQEGLELLKDFVSEAGGGVVFISGENANPARYLHTALYPLLPVEVPEAGRGAEARSPTERFNVELTGVGKEHAVMRLDNDPERNRELWENRDDLETRHLPAFYWSADVNREKPGAVKLAVRPTRMHPIYGPRPVFAFQNFGKGRSFYSGVDNTWRWRAGVDNLYFYRFWGQVVRFAASGRLLGKTNRFSITTDKQTYTIGDKVSIDGRVYDANMKPSTEETIRVFHQVESGGGAAPKAPEVITLSLNKVKGPGSYEGTITAEHLGHHEVWIGTENERLGTPRSFTVKVPDLEYRETRMDREKLKKIAEISGGKYHDFQDVPALVKELRSVTKPRLTAIEDRNEDLWDRPWVLLLLTALLAGEWICRKMVKLL
jgi:hypothetical protein